MEISSDNVFELISVYFTNAYWNKIYSIAVNAWREEQFDTVENAYRITMSRYAQAFCSSDDGTENKHYFQILRDIYMQYKEYFESGDTYLEFLDVVSSFLIPYEQYRRLSTLDQSKNLIVRKILTKTVMRFTLDISKNQEEVAKVNNKALRRDERTIIEWKKKFMDILNQERNEFCALLLAKTSGIDISNRDDIPQIPKEICDRMQRQIKELIDEKADLIHERNKLVKYIETLKKIIESGVPQQTVEPAQQPVQSTQQLQPVQQYQQPVQQYYHPTQYQQQQPIQYASRRALADKIRERRAELEQPALEELKAEEYNDDNSMVDSAKYVEVFQDQDELEPDD